MVDSNWYRQVTNRADRLVERIRKLLNKYTQREWDRTVGWGKFQLHIPKSGVIMKLVERKKILENGEVKNETLHTQTSRTEKTDNTDD